MIYKSKKEIKEILEKIFNSQPSISYEKLRNKVLEGYMYTIKSNGFLITTGKGGILEYLNICEKNNIDPKIVGNSIKINLKEDITLNQIEVTSI